ncbi:MAG: DUF1993 family protein [Alphaproteobacteria bacterium]|jgi:hypothetical protein
MKGIDATTKWVYANLIFQPAIATKVLFAQLNFYFYCATAHAILRQSAVEIGKRDFIGGLKGLCTRPARRSSLA